METKNTPNNTFFVYQTWETEKLISSGLSMDEAEKTAHEIDLLIEEGWLGNGGALVGDTRNPDDYFVCQRLGLTPLCERPAPRA